MSTPAKPQFLVEKEKYLNMSESERRNNFPYGVTILAQVINWEDYYIHNRERLLQLDTKEYVTKFSIEQYKENSELNKKISIWEGNITKLEVDAIVNAANNSLLGGGGVDGAIHKASGKFLLEECKILNGCETGDAKVTGGYKLPAKYVIHTVGPQGENAALLESCYKTSLQRMLENNLRSIAFPCISTGIYGYPQDAAAVVAIRTVRNFLEQNHSHVDRIIFCIFLKKDVEIYETLLQTFFPVSIG